MKSNRKQFLPYLIPILFLALWIASYIFSPQAARPVGWALLTVSIGTAVFLIVQKDTRSYKRGELTKTRLQRKLAVDISGLLLSLAAAIPAAGWAGQAAGQAVWQATGRAWAGIALGLLAGFTAGLGSGWLVRLGWGWLFKRGGNSPEIGADLTS